MKTLLAIAIFINLFIAGLWAMMGDVEMTLFAGLCSVLCWFGFVIRGNGEDK
jgi:hypothetical protein